MHTKIKSFLLIAAIASSASFAQTVSPNGVVNAGSLRTPVAPGSIITIFGTNLATASVAASSTPLPTLLGGTSVTVNGTVIPLLYVSPAQINAQLPYGIEIGTASLIVTVSGKSSGSAPVAVVQAAPGILTLNDGRAAATNQDGSVNGPEKATYPDNVITIYMTGQGPVDRTVQTGAASPAEPVAKATLPVTATVGGRNAEVLFAGLSPGGVGLFQVNVLVPVAYGDCPVVVSVGGIASNAANITIGWKIKPPPVEE